VVAADPFEALSLCAEIAIAITGFSGVVLVFDQRRGSASAELNRVTFRTLFTASLLPLGLIAVAFVLEFAGIERPTTWRVCSSIQVVGVSLTMLINVRSARAELVGETGRGLQRWIGWAVGGGAVTVIGLQVANAVHFQAFWLLLIAIWWGIAVSLVSFASLVFTPGQSEGS